MGVLPDRELREIARRVGVAAIKGVLEHPDLELVGCWVHSADKAGKDVGEIIGIEPVRRRRITAERVAIAAIMAGCLPEYMPVLLAAIEAAGVATAYVTLNVGAATFLPLRVDETLAIAALIQASVYKLWQLHAKNQTWRPYSRALIMENKWRASRYGIDGSLIDFGREVEVDERKLLDEQVAAEHARVLGAELLVAL